MPYPILDKIAQERRLELERDKRELPLEEVRSRLRDRTEPRRDFHAALAASGEISIIAETKGASPSGGTFFDPYDPATITPAFEEGGARAVSVLTEPLHFKGRWEHLTAVRGSVSLPILCKDFVVDGYQIERAFLAGADAILLIAELLSLEQIQDFLARAGDLGMECLVELYEPESLERVLRSGARIVGVNNRNLKDPDLKTDIRHSEALMEAIGPERVRVSESGIRSHEDLAYLSRFGIDAALIGESTLRAADPVEHLRKLRGVAP